MNSSLGKACLWLALLPLAAMADEPSVDADFFREFPVVLSASRLEQPANEAPATVTVIDRDMIKASGVRELADLFRLVPGMVVGRANGYSPILGFNGFGDSFFRQFQVLVDGVSIYSPLWGGVDWGELPFGLEDVERIEVVRGPNAATYGANSFLGVVNIITRDPATEPSFQASVSGGDNRIADEVVRVARNNGDWRYRISAGQRSDQGLETLPDDRRSNFLNLRSHYRINPTDELRFQFGYAGGYGEDSVSVVGQPFSIPARFETKNMQVRWTRANAADDEFWVQFDHAEQTHHEMLPYTLDLSSLGFHGFPLNLGSYNYPLIEDYDTSRTDIELQRTLKLQEGMRAVWGAQAREDAVRSQLYFDRPDWLTSRLWRLFGNLEWRPASAWLVHAGAMYESNSITGGSFSPSLALITHLTPEHSLRARVAAAQRTPTLFEDDVNTRFESPAALKALLAAYPNPLLRPFLAPLAALPLAQSYLATSPVESERIESHELSYLGQFPAWRMNLEVTVFNDRLRDLLAAYRYPYPTILGGTTTEGFRNRDWADTRGTNVELHWRPWEGARLIFAGSRTIIDSDNGDVAWSMTAPKHTASALFSQEFPAGTSLSLAYYRVGSMYWIGQSSKNDVVPAFDRVDIRVAKRFKWGRHKAELSWVTQNVFNPIPVLTPTLLEKRTSWIRLQYEY